MQLPRMDAGIKGNNVGETKEGQISKSNRKGKKIM